MLDGDMLPSGVDNVIRPASRIQKRDVSGEAAVPSSVDSARMRLTTVTIDYTDFRLDEPKFTNGRDRELFHKLQGNVNAIGNFPKGMLRGVIRYISGGLASHSFDCSWQTSLRQFAARTWMPARQQVPYLSPLLVPDGGSFQHFVDGVLPKLMQARDILLAANVSVLLHPPGGRIIGQMLSRLGFSTNSLIYYYGGYYKSGHQVNACVTPPYHPTLWSKARRLLGVNDQLKDDANWLIILMLRTRSWKAGRHIVNVTPLLQTLRARYGARLHVFYGENDLDKAKALFSRARALVGVHGGAFYNMLFAPLNTTVVEIMPTLDSGTVLPSYAAHSAFWKLAQTMGHGYWRLAEVPLTSEGNVSVNITRLVGLLDRLL